jgi:hypothetical protein
MNTTVLGFACVILGGIAITPLLVETDHAAPPTLETPATVRAACIQGAERPRPRPTDLQPQGNAPDCIPAIGLRMVASR